MSFIRIGERMRVEVGPTELAEAVDALGTYDQARFFMWLAPLCKRGMQRDNYWFDVGLEIPHSREDVKEMLESLLRGMEVVSR